MDNFSTHKLSLLYQHFTPQVTKSYIDRIKIIPTSAHGSWLNMAEIEFSVFTRQELDKSFGDKKEVFVRPQINKRKGGMPKRRFIEN
jgi:DDE superfamily endonuclease